MKARSHAAFVLSFGVFGLLVAGCSDKKTGRTPVVTTTAGATAGTTAAGATPASGAPAQASTSGAGGVATQSGSVNQGATSTLGQTGSASAMPTSTSPQAAASTAGPNPGATSTLGQPAAAQPMPAAAHSTGTPHSHPDTDPPLIQLVSPLRAQYTTLNAIAVEGTITDATGIAFFLVDGLPVIVGPNGQFSHPVQLSHGLNIIEITASDPLANITKSAIPVISGQFAPENQVVADALAVRLNRPTFDAIEQAAAQMLGGVNFGQQITALNPLYSGSAFGSSIELNATAVNMGTPVLDLDPQVGGLRVTAELPNIAITTRANGRILGIPYSLTVDVTVRLATVRALAVVDVQPGGVVTTTLRNTTVVLDDFRFDINNFPGFLERLARNSVRRLIEREIKKQVETVIPREINNAIAGANGPLTQTVMGQQITLQVIPTAVTFDANGASIATAGDLSLPPAPGLPTTPGSLVSPGAVPALSTGPAFLLSLNDDMLNRIGHAAWRGGLMSFTVDQTVVQQLRLPAFLQLDAFLLQVFFPNLIGVLNPADPIEIELSAGAPALFETLAAPDLLQASMGDLTVSIYVAPAGRPRELVLKVGTQVRMGVGVTISSANLIQLAVSGRPTIKSDVFETPLVPLNEMAVETLLDFVLPPVLQLLPRAWSGVQLPVHPAIRLRNLDLHQDGPGLDFLTLEGDL